ncbi:MAG: DsbA family protein [Chlorobiota bacterium]
MDSDKQKPTVLYVYDIMCGWCYGFSPVINKLYKEYNDSVDFETISGGMVTGDRVGPLSTSMSSYIKDAYKTIESRMGVEFGESYINSLDNLEKIQTSIPGSKLMTAFKSFDTKKSVPFAHELQNAIFRYGANPDSLEEILNSCDTFGVDKEKLLIISKSDKVEPVMNHDFELSRRLGVTGFPTVFIILNDEIHQIARGATKYENIKQRLESVLNS